jgi:hypothetical protein
MKTGRKETCQALGPCSRRLNCSASAAASTWRQHARPSFEHQLPWRVCPFSTSTPRRRRLRTRAQTRTPPLDGIPASALAHAPRPLPAPQPHQGPECARTARGKSSQARDFPHPLPADKKLLESPCGEDMPIRPTLSRVGALVLRLVFDLNPPGFAQRTHSPPPTRRRGAAVPASAIARTSLATRRRPQRIARKRTEPSVDPKCALYHSCCFAAGMPISVHRYTVRGKGARKRYKRGPGRVGSERRRRAEGRGRVRRWLQ